MRASPTDDADRELVHETKLELPAGSPWPRIRLMEYDADRLVETEIEDPSDLEPYADTSYTTWIDIQGLGDEARLRTVAHILGIHEVALADAVNIPQRAKTQAYEDHLLIVIRTLVIPFDAGNPPPQVCLLLAGSYLVTFQERYFGFFDEVRERLRDPKSMLRRSGPALLAYALTDVLIDPFYTISDALSEELDEVEDRILDRPSPKLVARVHQVQRQLTTLRRVARPQVDALYKLSHVDSPLVPDACIPFLRDVEDRARQVMGRLDAAREVATDLMSAVLATLGHRQNEIMKVLTLVGAIFIPLTFMAGIYGMNFEYMPELKHPASYPILILVMIAVALALVAYFRAQGWIGDRKDE